MRSYLILLLISFLSIQSFAQSFKNELIKEVNIYFDHFENKKIDGIFDYIYPKIFEMVSRKQMKKRMKQNLSGPDMKIEFLSNEVTNVSDKIENDGKSFALIYFDSDMKMTLLKNKYSSKEEKEDFLNYVKGTMEIQFGKGNVKKDIETMSLIVSISDKIFAINDPKYKGWKFMGNYDDMRVFIEALVPNDVKDELLKEKE